MSLAVWEHLSPEDGRKAKKSLLIVSALTIFVASIEITSDEITLLEFSVRISQARLISMGQLLSTLMLTVFILRSLPSFCSSVSSIIKESLRSKQKQDRINLQDSWGFHEYPDFDNSPEGEFNALEHHHQRQNEVLEEKLNIVSILLNSLSVLLIDYSIPILIGVIAVFAPEFPSSFSTKTEIQ